jgi:PiT family inorganic phosphate transporter
MNALLGLVLVGGAGLAVANGANDNGKPVATLIGSGVLSQKKGLGLAFWTTLAGSLAAALWSSSLLRAFSGQGLVSTQVMAHPAFLPSVGLAALGTVALATRLRLPISTTHALVGGLVGSGLVLGQGTIAWKVLFVKLAGPMLLSPVVAMGAAWGLAYLVRVLAAAKVEKACVCAQPAFQMGPGGDAFMSGAILHTGTVTECQQAGSTVLLAPTGKMLRGLHLVSAGAVSFSRGLNDTPKIAALLLPIVLLSGATPVVLVALAMGLGGWYLAKGVTKTMSQDIVDLEHREPEATGSNLTTAFLVLLASRWGLPVSTTHVATGAMVGTGLSHGEFRLATLRNIFLAWTATLPLAALLAVIAVTALKALA